MKRKLLSFFLLLFIASAAFSQNRQVMGKVISHSTYAPLPESNFSVKSTQTTVVTKSDGSFSITIPDKNDAVLVVTHVGYTPKEISVESMSTLGSITLNSFNNAVEGLPKAPLHSKILILSAYTHYF
jgi:hypothetical protein